MSNLPESSARNQVEAMRMGSTVNEALVQQLGGSIGFLLSSILPVGSIVYSGLSEAQFQAQSSSKWVLADGRSVAGSRYQTLTEASTIPDLRGIFLRGKNNGRSTATGNTAGDVALGTYAGDKMLDHTHTFTPFPIAYLTDTSPANTGTIEKDAGSEYEVNPFSKQVLTGGGGFANNGSNGETRPRSVIVACFIRIN